MICKNCSWRWVIEKNDENPFLCHKCGYDSQIGDFNMDTLKKWEKDNNYPFNEYKQDGFVIRTFKEDVNETELVWHRDREDRIVESIGFTDWMIQIDNELPKPLLETIYIPKNTFHRLIKGNGNLNVKVKKL